LLICLAAALLAWFFVLLGSDRTVGETRVFDRVILRSMQALRDGHTWAVPILRDLSAISANSAARSS